MKKILLIICLALFMAGCKNTHKVNKGYIVGMQYVPIHSDWYYNIWLDIPMTRIVPEEHFIWLADSVDVRKMCVDKETYNSVKVGSFYDSQDGKKDY